MEKQNEPHHIEICVGKEEDAEGIVAVHKASWIATYPNKELGITKEEIEARNWNNPKRVESLRSLASSENVYERLWVAKEYGKVVGYAVGKIKEDNELSAIYLLPEVQGKGIGTKLMTEFLNWADPKKNCIVEVASYNLGAIGFYRHFGFEGAEPLPAIEIPDFPAAKKIPLIRMRKVT
jgi:ribosomal protein S18 acetylase RimI-like enzyme